jgi:hypothetical protein
VSSQPLYELARQLPCPLQPDRVITYGGMILIVVIIYGVFY